MRAALDEEGESLGGQRLDRALQQHRLPQVAVPVLRVQLGSRQPGAGHRRVQRYCTRTRGDSLQLGQQPLADRLDRGRVRGVVHVDPADLDAVRPRGLHQFLERVIGTRHHHGLGPVHRGDRQPVVQPVPHLLRGQPHEHHPSGSGEVAQQPGPGGDHPGPVRQGQRTGDTRGGDLPLRVTHHPLRRNPPVLPQPGQRHHDGEQHGLDHVHSVGHCAVRAAQDLRQGPVDMRCQRLLAFPHRGREHLRLGEQPAAHTEPLRTLPGEHQCHSAAMCRVCDHRRGADRVRGAEHVEPVQQLLPVRGDDHGTVVEGGAGRRQRPCHVRRGEFGTGQQVRAQCPRLRGQAVRGPGRQDERQGPSGRARPLETRRGRGVRIRRERGPGQRIAFLQDHMGVGAADAERGHTCQARALPARPGPFLGQQRHRARRPVDLVRRGVRVQGSRQHLVPHRLHHLDHTADAGRRLGVPQVRLERAQVQRPVRLASVAVHGYERLGLYRVAEPGAGAVCLHGVHVRRGKSGVGQGAADDRLLGLAVRGGQAVAGAVGVGRRSAQHGQYGVAVGLGVGEALQDDEADALRPHGPVGRGREGLAHALGGQCAQSAEGDEVAGCGHHGDAAREGQRAFAVPQGLCREVDGDQGAGCGGVDRDRGSVQSEQIGDPAGHHAGRRAGEQVALNALGRLLEPGAVLPGLGADEHAGPAAADRGRGDGGALQCLPGGFEQQTLLGIHRQRLARRDVEKARVEFGGVLQESAPGEVCLAGALGVLAVEGFEIPVPVRGEVGNGLPLLDQEFPQALG